MKQLWTINKREEGDTVGAKILAALFGAVEIGLGSLCGEIFTNVYSGLYEKITGRALDEEEVEIEEVFYCPNCCPNCSNKSTEE